MGKLKWIWNHITKVDKLYHVLVGLGIFLVSLYVFGMSPANSVVVVFIAGAYKELSDEFIKKTGGDPWDFFATIFLPVLILLFFF